MSSATATTSGASSAFRNRAGEITRLEALSDGTFAFAITLLVVSLEVPSSFADLLVVLRGFPAFAVCFTLLIWIWFQHWRFFRRYGLEDAGTVALNSALLFVVLFYVYPLKFLWTYLLAATTRNPTAIPIGEVAAPPMRWTEGAQLMQVYGLGFLAIFFLLAMLYVRAYSKRDALQLNEFERFDTRSGIVENLAVAGVGLLSIAIVTFGGPRAGFFAGISYSLIGVVKAGHGYWHRFKRSRMELALPGQPAQASGATSGKG